MDTTAVLSRLIRDAAGVAHKPGEIVKIIGQNDKLGRSMVLIEYASAQRGYVYPEEIEQ